jgi:hypothetical protein
MVYTVYDGTLRATESIASLSIIVLKKLSKIWSINYQNRIINKSCDHFYGCCSLNIQKITLRLVYGEKKTYGAMNSGVPSSSL